MGTIFFTLLFGAMAAWALTEYKFRRNTPLAIFLSILGHKSVEAFSLATVLLLAGQRLRQVALLVGVLALMTPAGCIIGVLSLAALPGASPLAPVAIATGTFLYVALLDLLPEVLHHRQDLVAKVALMLAGLVFMSVVRAYV